jgi:hypothetical protein
MAPAVVSMSINFIWSANLNFIKRVETKKANNSIRG